MAVQRRLHKLNTFHIRSSDPTLATQHHFPSSGVKAGMKSIVSRSVEEGECEEGELGGGLATHNEKRDPTKSRSWSAESTAPSALVCAQCA
ncbi:hypothetical protein EYF80_053120 [Liparis tanakae]|uniref:Uncharacterized protein n=1 Tax=Liparis tanakae TaxID=230148 RepID=A0A4Z2F6B0_9TELE|nr:hypothetical protein EYF80_053120 [Liparis tanakae]